MQATKPKRPDDNNNNNNIKDRLTRQTNPVTYALNSLGSDVSKERYTEKLKLFFGQEFLKLEGNTLDEQGQAFLAKAKHEVIDNHNPYWIEDSIKDFLNEQKERVEKGEMEQNTVSTYYWPVKAFCDAHKRNLPSADQIDWDMLYNMAKRESTHSEDDRPYKASDIRKLMKNPNRRIKPMVLVMSSSGIRLRSWMYLQWKHVEPISNAYYLRLKKKEEEDKPPDTRNSDIINITITNEDENKIIAAKLTTYNTKRRRYYKTFITAEAYYALKEWMIDYRRDVLGEDINGESWLMINQKVSFGSAPKKMEYGTAKKLIERALKKERLRPKKLPEGKRRYEVKEFHGFRKFFETYAGTVMHPYNVILLKGRKLDGSENSYWKPTELQLLEDYLKAVPQLTIDYDAEKTVLQKKVTELTEKSEQQNYLIKKGLAEKEREVEETKKKLAELEAKQTKRFEEMEEQMMSRLLRIEASMLDRFPPKIDEDADKKPPVQILKELFDEGYTTVPLDKKSPHAYVLSEKKEESNNNEIITIPPDTELETKLHRHRQKQEEEERNLIY